MALKIAGNEVVDVAIRNLCSERGVAAIETDWYDTGVTRQRHDQTALEFIDDELMLNLRRNWFGGYGKPRIRSQMQIVHNALRKPSAAQNIDLGLQ